MYDELKNKIIKAETKLNQMQADIDSLAIQNKTLTDNNTEEIKKYELILKVKEEAISNLYEELTIRETKINKLTDEINEQSLLVAKCNDEKKVLQTKIDSLISGNQPITYTTKELVTMLIKSIFKK